MSSLSIWETQSFYARQDIIIVGAGLMGLWSAWELKQRNKALRITILERNPTPLGASTRNAGFACFGSPTELLHDAAAMGTDAMLGIVEMRYKGIEKIKVHFTEEQIGFDPCGGYECINRAYPHWQQLDEKTAWLNSLLKEMTGNENSFRRCDNKLPSLGLQGFDALVENTSEAALHSGKLVQALMEKVRAAGISILCGISVTGYERNASSLRLHTDGGINMATQHLLFCTNAFMGDLLPGLSIIPARGQVIVTSP
ncbi:MAG: hypothetical protein JWQ78_955, partial [Sediminibacterium sp.]|nr:hypothetical protein [Sediminibacterium sp.]